MGKIKKSFITTVFNEEENIEAFLSSIFSQTELPDEIIIVDGGSSDETVVKIKKKKSESSYKGKFLLLVKKGNRSVGRNEAIKHATGDIITCSDAGCILDKNWLKEISKPFTVRESEVVAGYYQGKPQNIFQKCLVPYVLVMPDRLDPKNFLPATRSIAFKKSVWTKVGGFPEEFSHNEDYVFATRLKAAKKNITLAENAIAYWLPRKNLQESFTMFFRFALGDAQAAIFRPKVFFIFLRYLAGILLLFSAIMRGETISGNVLVILIVFYSIWTVVKNYKYVKDVRSIVLLPVIQIISDIAVMSGTVIGIFPLWSLEKKQ